MCFFLKHDVYYKLILRQGLRPLYVGVYMFMCILIYVCVLFIHVLLFTCSNIWQNKDEYTNACTHTDTHA